MGLIKAAVGAAGGVLADQWKEYFYCEAMPADVLVTKAHKKVSGRSSNKHGSENIISNGSVIAVNDGQKTALMVVWETGDSPAPTEFVDDLAKETGVEREAIFYCATHSHAVPDAIKMSTTDPWMVYAHEQMLAAAKEAIANLEPASVGIGYTNSYINVNRNRVYLSLIHI